jgi:hypothetical protein
MTVGTAQRWFEKPFDLTGNLSRDVTVLGGCTDSAEEALATLPPVPERTPDQQRAAQKGHQFCHRLRTGFMRMHAHRIYDELTDASVSTRGLPSSPGAPPSCSPDWCRRGSG